MDLSVVIPTYNGAERLPRVLACLRDQVIPNNLKWEVVIVDNNSQDETAAIAQKQQSSWRTDVPLRYVFEPKQGLAFARQCGINKAQGKLVGFLDDDNLPDKNWVETALKFSQNHPKAGAFGSQIEGEFETQPSDALRPILFYLALTQRGDTPLKYDPRIQGVPPGAGIVVRRDAWLASVPKQQLLVGRIGKSTLSGEDAEALLYIHRRGWEIWYNPAMKIKHSIPASRLSSEYMKANIYGISLTRYHLRMLALHPLQRPFWSILYLVSDFYKMLIFYARNNSSFESDVVKECEIKRLIGTFLSPFYLFSLRVRRRFEGIT